MSQGDPSFSISPRADIVRPTVMKGIHHLQNGALKFMGSTPARRIEESANATHRLSPLKIVKLEASL